MRRGKLIDAEFSADSDLQKRQQTFIEPENWPPNSLDLNPVYYSLWGSSRLSITNRRKVINSEKRFILAHPYFIFLWHDIIYLG